MTPAATATSHRFNLRILVSPANADVAVARLKAAFGEGAELERRHAAEHATAGRLASSKFNSISEATSLHDFLWRMLTEEMEWSERVVAKDTDVVPRFRLITPDGDYHILVQMKDDELDRLARLKLVAGFMAWKMASAFIVSGETKDPAGIFSFAVAPGTVAGVFRSIERASTGEVTIGPPVTLGPDQCDPLFILMMPGPTTEIDAETMAQIEEVFGLGGEMEATRLH